MQKARFESIVTRIFEKYGYVIVAQNVQSAEELELVMARDGISCCMEVMPSRSPVYTNRGILTVAKNLEKRAEMQGWKPVVVTGGTLDAAQRADIRENNCQVELIDVENLLYMAQLSRELYDELIACLPYSAGVLSPREPGADHYAERDDGKDRHIHYHKINNKWSSFDDNYAYLDRWDSRAYGDHGDELSWREKREPQDNSDLIQEIQNWKGGRGVSPSAQYEKLCTRVLMRLFADDLTLWQEQANSDAGLFRFDLICKIKQDNRREFWEMAERYFQSKYIIFEFKNYAGQVTQKEVFTTVRYLYTKVLRRIAIIISPNGIDTHADKAIRGALRDEGKLILSLTNQELIHMLKMQQRGEKPADYLSEKLDGLLIDLEK